jgi:hypothetical protein
MLKERNMDTTMQMRLAISARIDRLPLGREIWGMMLLAGRDKSTWYISSDYSRVGLRKRGNYDKLKAWKKQAGMNSVQKSN